MEKLKVLSIGILHPSVSNPTMSRGIQKGNPIALTPSRLRLRNLGHSLQAKKSIFPHSKAASPPDSPLCKINANASWVLWKKAAELTRL
jgi:hypothetical protein